MVFQGVRFVEEQQVAAAVATIAARSFSCWNCSTWTRVSAQRPRTLVVERSKQRVLAHSEAQRAAAAAPLHAAASARERRCCCCFGGAAAPLSQARADPRLSRAACPLHQPHTNRVPKGCSRCRASQQERHGGAHARLCCPLITKNSAPTLFFCCSPIAGPLVAPAPAAASIAATRTATVATVATAAAATRAAVATTPVAAHGRRGAHGAAARGAAVAAPVGHATRGPAHGNAGAHAAHRHRGRGAARADVRGHVAGALGRVCLRSPVSHDCCCCCCVVNERDQRRGSQGGGLPDCGRAAAAGGAIKRVEEQQCDAVQCVCSASSGCCWCACW